MPTRIGASAGFGVCSAIVGVMFVTHEAGAGEAFLIDFLLVPAALFFVVVSAIVRLREPKTARRPRPPGLAYTPARIGAAVAFGLGAMALAVISTAPLPKDGATFVADFGVLPAAFFYAVASVIIEHRKSKTEPRPRLPGLEDLPTRIGVSAGFGVAWTYVTVWLAMDRAIVDATTHATAASRVQEFASVAGAALGMMLFFGWLLSAVPAAVYFAIFSLPAVQRRPRRSLSAVAVLGFIAAIVVSSIHGNPARTSN